jgi:hypothetical protein
MSLADTFASMYPNYEAAAHRVGAAFETMLVTNDAFFDGLKETTRGLKKAAQSGKALLSATWRFHKACRGLNEKANGDCDNNTVDRTGNV